jgi:hypothetical protein
VTAYSIGYLGVAEARSFGVSYAKIGNAAGQYISPTAAAVQEAMSAFGTQFEALARDRSTNFFVDIVDPQNSPAAYPIATFTYIVFNTDLLACETLLNVVYMIYWAWTDGAVEMASNQPLVPLTETVRSACMSALGGLKCDGKAPLARAQIAFGLGCQPGASNAPLFLASLFSSNFPRNVQATLHRCAGFVASFGSNGRLQCKACQPGFYSEDIDKELEASTCKPCQPGTIPSLDSLLGLRSADETGPCIIATVEFLNHRTSCLRRRVLKHSCGYPAARHALHD